MNNLSANYERILEVLRKISNENLLSYQRRVPKMKDLELISLALTAEYMGIASQQMSFYGYKLHAVCSVNGVFQSIDLSPASVHDIHYLKDIREQLSNCTLLGDKGYLSSEIQIDLFNYANIELETPKRINQKEYKP